MIRRYGERGKGGQFGAEIAFSLDINHLFPALGARTQTMPGHRAELWEPSSI